MAAFGFRKAASIHPSCHRRKLGLTHVASLAQTPEHDTDRVGKLLVMIVGTTTQQIVNRDDQVFKSERPMTAGASASCVLASLAARHVIVSLSRIDGGSSRVDMAFLWTVCRLSE